MTILRYKDNWYIKYVTCITETWDAQLRDVPTGNLLGSLNRAESDPLLYDEEDFLQSQNATRTPTVNQQHPSGPQTHNHLYSTDQNNPSLIYRLPGGINYNLFPTDSDSILGEFAQTQTQHESNHNHGASNYNAGVQGS